MVTYRTPLKAELAAVSLLTDFTSLPDNFAHLKDIGTVHHSTYGTITVHIAHHSTGGIAVASTLASGQ